MSGKTVLRFQFMGKNVDVIVDDIDKVMWIDLIIEYEESCKKKGFDMPAYPSFHYVYKMKHVAIDSDKDLMTMFQHLSDRELIYIWVGMAAEATNSVQAARRLLESQKKGPSTTGPKVFYGSSPTAAHVNTGHSSTKTLLNPTEPLVNTSHSPVNHAIEDKFHDLMISPFSSPDRSDVVPPAPDCKGKSKLVTKTGVPRRSPRFTKPSISVCQPTGPSTQPTNLSKTLKKTAMTKHKIPRSTAARKGLILSEPSVNLFEDEGAGSLSRNELRASDASEPPVNDNATCDQEEEEHERDDEGLMAGVHDNYDPFVDDTWDNGVDEDSNNYFAKMYANGELYKEAAFGSIVLKPWMLFHDKDHFKAVLKDYCIQSAFAIVVQASSPTRFTAVCKELNCGWRIHSSVLADGKTWAIKRIENMEHTCSGLDERNPMVDVEWAATKLMDDIRANEDISAKSLNDLLWGRYGVKMPQSTVYKMRDRALKEINGGHDESYGLLPKYCEMIKLTNSGSAAYCAWKSTNQPERPLIFSSIFIAFKGVVDGVLAGCRRLVGVDGAHLKGNYGGVLLSAVAIDGNNELMPFAWAIVSSEDADSWKFFLWHLKQLLQSSNRGDKWCIISDRQKGIDTALGDIWPKVGRRWCCKHLAKNWKTNFPGPLMHALFWRACAATSFFSFKKAMTALQKANPLSLVWLSKLGPQSRWSKHAFDPDICSDENKTNFVESFNATLGVDRSRPVLTLLEGIRRTCMVRMATRAQVCEEWSMNEPCPNIIRRLQLLKLKARTCKPFLSSPGEYEVMEGRSTLPVSLNNKTCICGAWQISGLPCRHAMRCIIAADEDPNNYVSNWYSVAVYKLAYNSSIKAIPDQDCWPEIDMPLIFPPKLKRGIGRPSRNRRREEGEKEKGKRSKTVRCNKCNSFGHNSRTCKGGLTGKEKREGFHVEVHPRPPKAKASKAKGVSPATQPTPQIQPNQSPTGRATGKRKLCTSSQPPTEGTASSTRSKKQQKILNRLRTLE